VNKNVAANISRNISLWEEKINKKFKRKKRRPIHEAHEFRKWRETVAMETLRSAEHVSETEEAYTG